MLKTLLGLVAMGGTGVKLKKKIVVASVVGVVALVAAVPAFADCVNPSRSDQGNAQIAANSPTLKPSQCFYSAVVPCSPFLTINQLLLVEFEMPDGSFPTVVGALCPADAQYLVDQIDKVAAELGIDLTWMVGGEAVQSGGQVNASNPRVQQNLFNGKGIDLLRANTKLADFIRDNFTAAQAVPCGP